LRTVFVLSLLTLAVLNLTSHSQAFGKSNKKDGRNPAGPLIMDPNGNFYRTTATGGAHRNGAVQGDGTVFELTTTGTETVLYSFGDAGTSDGQSPGGLIMVNGNFSGTTGEGGTSAYGTVFELTANTGGNWTESVLYSFI
jgi:hypothetical protein